MTGSRSARHPNSHAHLRMSRTATALSGPNRQSLEGDHGATTTVGAVRACRAAHGQFTGAPFRLFVPDRSRGPFTTGDRQLLFPSVIREGKFAWAGGAAGHLVLCAAAYLIKCGYEVAQRRLNVPKTLYMTLAASLFFITPTLENLDVAFQGPEHLAFLSVQGPRHERLGHGRPLRCPRLGPVRRRASG